MNKYIFIPAVIIFLILIIFPTLSSAHVDDKIQSIEMNIYVQDNGDAIITENWSVKSIERFSYYKAYNNLNGSTITNFSVKDENDIVYTFLSDWKVSMSNENKVNNCGISYKDNGVELCWGVAEDGNHEYTLTYYITNFIRQYNDKQGICFDFIASGFIPIPNIVKIEITSGIQFNNRNTKIYSYGYNGENTISKDGNIILYNEKTFNHIKSLIALDSQLFRLDNGSYTNMSFKELKKQVELENKQELKAQDTVLVIILITVSIVYLLGDTISYIHKYKNTKEE